LPYNLSRSKGSQQWFSAAVRTAPGEEVITMNKTVKTWRILNQIYPKDKTVFSKDKWCIAEAVIVFILAIGLT